MVRSKWGSLQWVVLIDIISYILIPPLQAASIYIGYTISAILFIAELLFIFVPGTKGPNRFGEDPLVAIQKRRLKERLKEPV